MLAANDTGSRPPEGLSGRQLKEKLQELRRTDNSTNWFYVGRAYAVISVAVAIAVAFHQWTIAHALSPWWNVPVVILAAIAVGASQHQLAGATHEATHYILFRNPLLNELVSDWLCLFPLFSSTYMFRLHHLAHHQYINDPERDPDFSQLRRSGHWLEFPVSKAAFLRTLLRQLSLYPLVKYMVVRARYASLGKIDNNPYAEHAREFSPWPRRLAVTYLGILAPGMVWASRGGGLVWLTMLPLVGIALVTGGLLTVPCRRYPVSRLRPVISARTTLISRVVYVTLLFTAIAWAEYLTAARVWRYFFLLWLVPLFTTFSFFMILRQLVQHGNGDRGRLTNTRTFLVNPFIRYAVFPFGMDYHLPHHLFATVPHYRLPELHALLMRYPEYRGQGTVVEGYFFPRAGGRSGRNPTVLEVLGPLYTRNGGDVFIDHSVLEGSQLAGSEAHGATVSGTRARRNNSPS
ncbi:MAG TPA: fatty acid desaturase [Candidatus Binatia bacterium]|jgi:fatty acid desaturase|nr:fatty acid desaturase [Candidatus Binatia bacterium]